MTHSLTLGIYSLEKTLFEGTVQEIVAKTVTGEITILENHIPLISELASGILVALEPSGKRLEFKIERGFLEVRSQSHVVILVQAQ